MVASISLSTIPAYPLDTQYTLHTVYLYMRYADVNCNEQIISERGFTRLDSLIRTCLYQLVPLMDIMRDLAQSVRIYSLMLRTEYVVRII